MTKALRLALAVLVIAPAAASADERLLIVVANDTPRFRQALAGIERAAAPTTILEVAIAGEATIREALSGIGRGGAIITLGAAASGLVARAAPAAPVVDCMAGDALGARTAPGTLVVPADVPVDSRIRWLRRLLPETRSVGVLFDPARDQVRAQNFSTALLRGGYVPVLEPVADPTALPGALARLAGRVDVLHAIAGSTVYMREHSRPLLLFSFRRQVPLVGPTEAWVRAGALYAVAWDYGDLGRYCAALAKRQAAGGRGAPPAPARERVVVNAHSARLLNIAWDAQMLHSVDRVYE
ncbi:MAG: hypothetical protein IT521_02390 [Burkholderiales bacterium]|nr:hypothetical protein [Burkholderiales bacterium]